jgi:hypothetical protein
MASALYDKAKENFMNALSDLDTDDVRVILVNVSGTGTLYTFSAAHANLSDVASAARISDAAVALAGRTITSGVFDACRYGVHSRTNRQLSRSSYSIQAHGY